VQLPNFKKRWISFQPCFQKQDVCIDLTISSIKNPCDITLKPATDKIMSNLIMNQRKNKGAFMMSKVISIHEYILKPDASERQFVKAILNAKERGLLRLPGLVDYYLVKGIRGFRHGLYAAVWVYESKEAWESLWGPKDKPINKTDYPENWKIWENEVLFPFLDQDPDKIKFTSYQEF
jgi:hypothetical protein